MWSKLSEFKLIAIVIFLIAIATRLTALGQIPGSLYWDEAAMLVDAKAVSQTGHDMHGRPWFQILYPSYGDFKLPVYIWLASASVKLLGITEFALRLPSAISGIAMVGVAGLLAYRLLIVGNTSSSTQSTAHRSFASLVALAIMAILTLSPWSLMFSRTAFEGHVGQFLLTLSLLLLTYQPTSKWFGVLSGLVGGLATYSYFSVRFVWPITFALVWLYIYRFELQEIWKRSIQKAPSIKNQRAYFAFVNKLLARVFKEYGLLLVIPMVIFGLTLIPMLNSPLYKDSNAFRLGTDSVLKNEQEILQSNIYRERAGNTRIDRIVFHRWWLTLRELAKNYADHVSLDFIFVSGDSNLRHGTGQYGLFALGLLPAFLIGWAHLANKRPALGVVLLTWWLCGLLPASVPENTPHALRSLNALFPLSLVISLGYVELIHFFSQFIFKKNSIYKQGLVGIVIVGSLALLHVSFLYHYFTFYATDSAPSWQEQYKEVALALYQQRKPQQPVFVASFDDKWYLWLLAYGPYSSEEFQKWPTNQYQFHSFDKITFELPANISEPVLVIGRSSRLAEWLNQSEVTIVSDKRITGIGTDADYRLLEVAPK
jgi:4-amino-4-deoxy-L-arabinose transferase-like glycosyltransferase